MDGKIPLIGGELARRRDGEFGLHYDTSKDKKSFQIGAEEISPAIEVRLETSEIGNMNLITTDTIKNIRIFLIVYLSLTLWMNLQSGLKIPL